MSLNHTACSLPVWLPWHPSWPWPGLVFLKTFFHLPAPLNLLCCVYVCVTCPAGGWQIDHPCGGAGPDLEGAEPPHRPVQQCDECGALHRGDWVAQVLSPCLQLSWSCKLTFFSPSPWDKIYLWVWERSTAISPGLLGNTPLLCSLFSVRTRTAVRRTEGRISPGSWEGRLRYCFWRIVKISLIALKLFPLCFLH